MKLENIISYLALILPMFFIYSCGLKYAEEKEMNDSFQAANIIYAEKIMKGSLSSNNDIDYYNLRIKNLKGYNQKILANIRLKNPGNFTYDLRIFNKNQLLKKVSQKSKEIDLVNMMFDINDLRENRIFLVISSENSKNENYPLKYSLDVSIKYKGKFEEGEPDDEAVFAQPILKNDDVYMVKGYFNPGFNPLNKEGFEEDWYKYKVSYIDTQSKDKSIKVDFDLTAVPDIDSEITIFDDLGYLIRSGDSYGIGESERLLNVLLREGTYYIRIRSIQPGQQNIHIPYIFKISKVKDEYTESEPNDSYPMANLINFSEEIKGYFNPIGDVDWYRCNIYDVNPQVLTIKAEPTAYIDYKISLFSSSNKPIITVDDRGKDEGEIIKNIGVGPGVYYIKLENKDQGKDIPQNEYSLIVYKNEWKSDEEFELNNDFNSANDFTLGTLKKGYITPVGDVDFYKIQIDEEKTIRFEISPCVLLDLYLDVYDSEGNLIKKIDSNGEGMGEEGDIKLSKGIYFIKVGSNNKNENSRDFYMLRIYPKD